MSASATHPSAAHTEAGKDDARTMRLHELSSEFQLTPAARESARGWSRSSGGVGDPGAIQHSNSRSREHRPARELENACWTVFLFERNLNQARESGIGRATLESFWDSHCVSRDRDCSRANIEFAPTEAVGLPERSTIARSQLREHRPAQRSCGLEKHRSRRCSRLNRIPARLEYLTLKKERERHQALALTLKSED